QAGARKLVHDLHLGIGRDERLLDLEAVAHGDVVYVEAHGRRPVDRWILPRGSGKLGEWTRPRTRTRLSRKTSASWAGSWAIRSTLTKESSPSNSSRPSAGWPCPVAAWRTSP